MGLLLLTLTISGLALHGWLLIEIQLNLFVFNGGVLNGTVLMKLDRIVNPIKNTFLTNPNTFIYTVIFFIKYLSMSFILSSAIES